MGNFCCMPTKPQPEPIVASHTSLVESMSLHMNGKLRHPIAEIYFQDFRRNRDGLVRTLYYHFNETVFNNLMPRDMEINFTFIERSSGITDTFIGDDGSRCCVIFLCSLHMENPQRLCHTLIHEMCHAAVWLFDGIHDLTDDGHGMYWLRWTEHAKSIYPFMNIERYDRHITYTRYIYICNKSGCNYDSGERSLLAPDQSCPECRCGTLQLKHSYIHPHFRYMQENCADEFDFIDLEHQG